MITPLRVGLVPAEVAGHAVRLAAVGGFQVVIAGVRVPAAPCAAYGQFTPSSKVFQHWRLSCRSGTGS